MVAIKVRFDRKFDNLHSKMLKLLDGMRTLSGPVLNTSDTGWMPDADIYETKDEIVLVVNIAGVRKKDLEISFQDNFLCVGGERVQSTPPGTVFRYHQLEIGQGRFERIISIPALIKEDEIEASCADGLLTVRMKKDKKPGEFKVEVKS
jgi:HSP20 family protein